jgi:hypothetical protein
MAGRRLRQAVKNTLVKNGNGQFNSNTRVVIAALAGDYSQYIATYEEYEIQRYEVITCPALGLLDRLWIVEAFDCGLNSETDMQSRNHKRP